MTRYNNIEASILESKVGHAIKADTKVLLSNTDKEIKYMNYRLN